MRRIIAGRLKPSAPRMCATQQLTGNGQALVLPSAVQALDDLRSTSQLRHGPRLQGVEQLPQGFVLMKGKRDPIDGE